MKCQNCGYIHGYEWVGDKDHKDHDNYQNIKGKSGDFFDLPIKMERAEMWADKETRNVYGCPQCGILFMDKY